MPLNVVVILGTIATIVLTVLVYILIMPKSRYNNLNGFGKFLHNFFHFKKLYIESVIRFFYVLENVACVGYGVFLLVGKIEGWYTDHWTFLYGLCMIVLGPIALRLVYECVMLSILLVKNTMEINNKIGGASDNISFGSGDAFTEKLSNVAVNAAAGAAAAAQNNNNQQPQYGQPYQPQQYGQPYPQQPQYGQQPQQTPVQPQAPVQPAAPAPEAPAQPTTEAPAQEAPTESAPAANVCPKCGTPITGNGKFCFKCGNPLQ